MGRAGLMAAAGWNFLPMSSPSNSFKASAGLAATTPPMTMMMMKTPPMTPTGTTIAATTTTRRSRARPVPTGHSTAHAEQTDAAGWNFLQTSSLFNSSRGNANDNANNADGEADADSSDDAASFEGQSCTDGDFDGVCLANGRCALQIPPNINSEEFVSGQCGQ